MAGFQVSIDGRFSGVHRGWEHALVHEGISPANPALSYPRCASGARRCPPEDCGGLPGYEEFLEAISNPDHPEHESMLEWVGGEYDPGEFDARRVRFDDPAKRWKLAFGR
jgi:hypothetical protein